MWPVGQLKVHVGKYLVLDGLAWPSTELNQKSLRPSLKTGLLHIRRFMA